VRWFINSSQTHRVSVGIAWSNVQSFSAVVYYFRITKSCYLVAEFISPFWALQLEIWQPERQKLSNVKQMDSLCRRSHGIKMIRRFWMTVLQWYLVEIVIGTYYSGTW